MYDDNDWVESFKSRRTWLRGLYMLLYAAALWFSRILLNLMAVVQFGSALFTGRPVSRLLPFGRGLSAWMREAGLFLTWNTEEMPWPAAPWPDGEEGADPYRADDAEDWDRHGEAADTPFVAPPPEPPAPEPEEPEGAAEESTDDATEGEEQTEEPPGEPPRPDA